MAEKVTVRIWQGRKRSFYWLYTMHYAAVLPTTTSRVGKDGSKL